MTAYQKYRPVQWNLDMTGKVQKRSDNCEGTEPANPREDLGDNVIKEHFDRMLAALTQLRADMASVKDILPGRSYTNYETWAHNIDKDLARVRPGIPWYAR
jgi:hypothetical protein